MQFMRAKKCKEDQPKFENKTIKILHKQQKHQKLSEYAQKYYFSILRLGAVGNKG